MNDNYEQEKCEIDGGGAVYSTVCVCVCVCVCARARFESLGMRLVCMCDVQ